MSKYREQILKLRSEGKTYNEIVSIVGCSKSQVAYCANLTTRKQNSDYQYQKRREKKQLLREEAGGKCKNCNYNKCQAALDFHHIDPTTKKFDISDGKFRIEVMREEARKCILLCKNCHTELHENLRAGVG